MGNLDRVEYQYGILLVKCLIDTKYTIRKDADQL